MFEHVDVSGLDPEQVAEIHRFASLLRMPADASQGAAMAQWQLDRAQVQAVLDGISLTATDAFDQSLVWTRDGARSAAAWLTANTATTRVAAHVRLKTSRLAAQMPHVNAAARRGELSADAVHHLARARTPETADAFDTDEAWLVARLAPLRADAARAELASWRLGVLERTGRNEPDGPAPTPDSDLDRLDLTAGFAGRGLLTGDLTPAGRAIVFSGIEAEIDRWHREGTLTDDTRTRSELHGTAFLDIFRRGLTRTDQHGAPRPLVLAIIDTDTLAGRHHDRPAPGHDPGAGRGTGSSSPQGSRSEADERWAGGAPPGADSHLVPSDHHDPLAAAIARFRRRSEIVGIGPVPVETIRRLLCQGDVARIVTDGDGRPIDVGRTQRCFTPAQWKALIIRSNGHCEWPGCDVPHQRTQAHHLHPWEQGGPTDLTNALLVCNHHHHLLHEGGFTARHAADGPVDIRRPDGTRVTTQLHHAA